MSPSAASVLNDFELNIPICNTGIIYTTWGYCETKTNNLCKIVNTKPGIYYENDNILMLSVTKYL